MKNRVSIIIPLYNYARWIGQAVHSALLCQPREIIIVDDASQDSPIIPPGVKLIRFDKNRGVAAARNAGILKAKGDLILCLDADDKLIPGCLPRLVPEFLNPRVGIAFAPLDLINEMGVKSPYRWFEANFDYKKQRAGQNMVPTCSMFRKTAWERAGGFRSYEKPCEDAGLWLRIASQGWTVKNIGSESMLEYRLHHQVSKFRTGSETKLNPVFDWWKHGRAWSDRSAAVGELLQMYDCPRVSFLIDYNAGTEQGFIRTLDSIEGMKAIEWEICATGKPPKLIRSGWPFVRWNMDPTTRTEVYLEPGDILTDDEWKKLTTFMEFPE